LQPCLGLAEQARQPAMVFGRQGPIVQQFSAMHNNSPLALNAPDHPPMEQTTQMGAVASFRFAIPT
jgi:hypothetical protein